MRARISYDALYQRERVIEEFQLGKQDDVFDVLYLHKQNVEYRFNLRTKECNKTTVTREWRNFGIPSNAKYLGESYIGSSAVPGAGILATLWSDEFVDQKGEKIEYFGEWTYEGCLPISTTYYSKEVKGGLNAHDRFFDITPGYINSF